MRHVEPNPHEHEIITIKSGGMYILFLLSTMKKSSRPDSFLNEKGGNISSCQKPFLRLSQSFLNFAKHFIVTNFSPQNEKMIIKWISERHLTSSSTLRFLLSKWVGKYIFGFLSKRVIESSTDCKSHLR